MSSPCLCTQMCSVHMYLWKCVHVFAWMQKLFWPVNLHLSLSLSSLQACRRWSVKASTASLLIEDASRLLWCPAGTAAADRCQREGDRGRHRTYNNNSGNKFEKWENTLAHRNHSITLTMLRRGTVLICLHGRERKTEKKHLRQRGKKVVVGFQYILPSPSYYFPLRELE